MWFKRKRKNRRFERTRVLEVKLSSVQRRKARLRRATLVLGTTSCLLLGIVVVWRGGDWLLRRLIYENPAFAIHHLDVQTDGNIALEQLRHWAGVKLQDNLLALDLARVKRDLELAPMIRSVAIERILPHTLRVRVTEREPIAQFIFPHIRAAGVHDRGVYLLDGEGYVMLPLEPNQRSLPALTNDHLPVLIGIQPVDLRPGGQAGSPQVHAALRFIEAFQYSSMVEVVELKHVDLTSPSVLQVTTTQGSEVTFGLDDFGLQLRRWRNVHEYGQRTGKHVAFLDLSVSNNVPARWLEASLVSPLPPRPTRPSYYRKRNV
jgi:cell division septal protein FtsQ